MATWPLSIPDAEVARTIEALCAQIPTPPGETPPAPTAAAAKAVVIAHIKRVVHNYEEYKARKAALEAIPATTDVTIT